MNIKTLRQFKIFNIAVFDVVATYLVAKYFAQKYKKKVNTVFIAFIFLAVAVHKIFNIPTMFNHYLGLNSYDAVIQARQSS